MAVPPVVTTPGIAPGVVGVRTHGEAWPHRSAEYTVWCSMIQRCRNPRHLAFPRYGGRGISVCIRWADSYAAFLDDMGRRPEGHELDRIDPDGDYSPENCRWLPASENRARRRLAVSHCACGKWVGAHGHQGPCTGDTLEDMQ